jgi:hypothetical protein
MYVQVAEERPTARPVHRTNHSNNNAGNNDPKYVWRTDNGSSGPELNDASFYLSAKSSCSDKRNNEHAMHATKQSSNCVTRQETGLLPSSLFFSTSRLHQTGFGANRAASWRAVLHVMIQVQNWMMIFPFSHS